MRSLYKQYGDPGDVAYHAVVGTVSSPSTAVTSPSKTRTSVLKPHPRLLIKPLYEDLLKVARASGQGSQKTRQMTIERLILCAVGAGWSTKQGKGKGKGTGYQDVNEHLRGEEARFLVRTLAQNLRVGAVRTTILSALARASALSSNPEIIGEAPGAADVVVTEAELQVIRRAGSVAKKGARKKTNGGDNDRSGDGEALRTQVTQRLLHAEALVKRAYSQHPSYDDIVAVILAKGPDGLRTTVRPDTARGLPGVGLTLGTPLMPTLGSPMRSLDDVYERLGSTANWTAEMKYDGQRAQVHAWRDYSEVEVKVKVKIFSRHLEDMTDKVGLVTFAAPVPSFLPRPPPPGLN
jgi:DNA ligase-1